MTPSRIRKVLGGGDDAGMDGLIQLTDVDGDCSDDIEDLVYLADTLGMVESLEMNENGSVKAVNLNPESEDDMSITTRTCSAA